MTTKHIRPDSVNRVRYQPAGSPSKRRRLSSDHDSSDDSILASLVIPKEKSASGYSALHTNGPSRKDWAKEERSIRRRRSSDQGYSSDTWSNTVVLPEDTINRGYGKSALRFNGGDSNDQAVEEESITISATSKQATQTVAPFLAKHIPEQYAPMGGLDEAGHSRSKDTNTKYCYRHRPDVKCRRQANEPSMDQLQHVCIYVLF